MYSTNRKLQQSTLFRIQFHRTSTCRNNSGSRKSFTGKKSCRYNHSSITLCYSTYIFSIFVCYPIQSSIGILILLLCLISVFPERISNLQSGSCRRCICKWYRRMRKFGISRQVINNFSYKRPKI